MKITNVRLAKKIVYYHGLDKNGVSVYSYQCGYCCMSADRQDYYCRWCGAKFVNRDSVIEEEELI